MSNDEWINATEAQAYIGRTDRQLRRYAQQGRVRTRKRGGRRFERVLYLVIALLLIAAIAYLLFIR